MYRVGFPGWSLAARLGVPLLLKLEVLHDLSEEVLVITSKDLKGLVVEVPANWNAEQIHKEVHGCVTMLLEERVKPAKPRAINTAWPGEFQPA